MTAKYGHKMPLASPLTEETADCGATSVDQRQLLITYLEYVVADVAQIDPTSASLLLMAIANLETGPDSGDMVQPYQPLQ